jgi:GNAT superfamily N-acetyltransferase
MLPSYSTHVQLGSSPRLAENYPRPRVRSKVKVANQFEIRKSTQLDIDAIHAWLEDEEARRVEGNFLCNWNLTLQKHRTGKLLVCANRLTGEPVGYQWGGLLSPGILQVRSGFRRSGIGSKLVQHCIAQARRRNEMILHIQCVPPSSIPFWTQMGFSVYSEDGHAIRTLEKRNSVPPGGEPEHVTIEVYPEARKYEQDTPPTRVFSPKSRRYPDGTVSLAERVSFFHEIGGRGRDTVLRVIVGGTERYLDKAKYESARALGLRSCTNGWFIDVIRTLTPSQVRRSSTPLSGAG